MPTKRKRPPSRPKAPRKPRTPKRAASTPSSTSQADAPSFETAASPPSRSGRWRRWTFAAVLATVGCLAGVWFLAPSIALRAIYKFEEARSGLTERSVNVGGYRIPYYEGGNGPVVVMVHGYGDSKIAFVRSSRWITSSYRVIILDLPGHGDTAHDPARNHSIRSQVQTLHGFVTALHLDHFDLVGNSMGGHISAAYALAFPAQVHRMVLLDPAGLRIDDPIPYRGSKKPIETDEDFDAYLSKAFVHKPWVPSPFRKHFIANSARNFAWLNHIAEQIRTGPDYILNDRISGIRTPTLIVWGEGDGIISVKHAPVWRQGIRGSQLVILKEMGHGPQYENPELTARLIMDFLAGRTAGKNF